MGGHEIAFVPTKGIFSIYNRFKSFAFPNQVKAARDAAFEQIKSEIATKYKSDNEEWQNTFLLHALERDFNKQQPLSARSLSTFIQEKADPLSTLIKGQLPEEKIKKIPAEIPTGVLQENDPCLKDYRERIAEIDAEIAAEQSTPLDPSFAPTFNNMGLGQQKRLEHLRESRAHLEKAIDHRNKSIALQKENPGLLAQNSKKIFAQDAYTLDADLHSEFHRKRAGDPVGPWFPDLLMRANNLPEEQKSDVIMKTIGNRRLSLISKKSSVISLSEAGNSFQKASTEAEKKNPNEQAIHFYLNAAALYQLSAREPDSKAYDHLDYAGITKAQESDALKASCLKDAADCLFTAGVAASRAEDKKVNHYQKAAHLYQAAAAWSHQDPNEASRLYSAANKIRGAANK